MASMDVTEKLKAWGSAHAQARAAEQSARAAEGNGASPDLQRKAQSLRERADQLHRDIYRDLDRRERDLPD